jgi:NAD(P)-dependent dehydrogenase (short-subunit alcohol dehydrogenase family)
MKKTVLLCGATQGLGHTIAQRFLALEWNVVILDLLGGKEGPIHFYPCDVSDFAATQKSIDQIIEKFHAIDALVNCIRYRKKKECHLSAFESWKKSIDIDLNTFFNASSLVCEHMKQIQRGCSIINISSVLSELVTDSESIGYHAAKAAINQLTRCLAVEFGPHNIRVNAISPGLISNHHSEPCSRDPSASPYAKFANHIPLRRSGDPQEVADLVLFLTSPSSSFITGQNIVIDGGLSIREQLCVTQDF